MHLFNSTSNHNNTCKTSLHCVQNKYNYIGHFIDETLYLFPWVYKLLLYLTKLLSLHKQLFLYCLAIRKDLYDLSEALGCIEHCESIDFNGDGAS